MYTHTLSLSLHAGKREEEEGILTCRTSVQIWPTSVRNRSPVIHSWKLSLVSRAKSCKCDTSRSRTYFMRSSLQSELIWWTFCVILSAVRSFMGGIFTCDGSMLCYVMLCLPAWNRWKDVLVSIVIAIESSYLCDPCPGSWTSCPFVSPPPPPA